MRVTIRHRQEDGLLPNKKRYYIDCTVLFSEEEKAIIQTRGLGQHYIVTDSDMPPPAGSQRTLATLLKALSPLVFVSGCITGIGMTIAGNNHGGDLVGGTTFFAAIGMLLAGIALKRHVRLAEQPSQTITLGRLLSNPSFSAYAFDNVRAKVLDQQLRDTLTGLKETLLVNRDVREEESFEL